MKFWKRKCSVSGSLCNLSLKWFQVDENFIISYFTN